MSAAGPYSIGSDNFPGLAKVAEEAGEVIQVIGKIIALNGNRDHWDGTDVLIRLMEELGDLLAAIRFLRICNPLDQKFIDSREDAKFILFQQWHREQLQAEVDQ